MKKYILPICLQILSSISSNAQQTSKFDTMYQHIFATIPDVISFVNCVDVALPGCNKVFNPELATNGSYNGDPWLVFNNGYINNWSNSHGTPNIESNNLPTAPPFPGTHGAYMEFSTMDGGEGITGKIKPLTAFKPYSLSFFQNQISVGSSNWNEYNIYLMHCNDAPLYFNPMSYLTPTPPPHSQQIYCQKDFPVSSGWNQVAIDFIPNESYDLIWIFPKITYSPSLGILNIGFSYPEIISNETYNAGPNPTPIPGSCTVTIGPSTPNCGVKNSVYTWYGPNGQVRPALPNQKLDNINTSPGSLDIGIWTLKMTVVVGSIWGNNICSNPINVQANVEVPVCGSTCTPPIISPSGPIDYYSTGGEISEGYGIILTSSSSNGNQWYKNGTLVPNETGNILKAKVGGDYLVKVGNCSSNSVSILLHPYTGSFLLGRFNMPVQTSGYECLNTNPNIKQFDLGPTANYTWNTSIIPSVPALIQIDPLSYNIHSPNANIIVGNIAGNSPLQAVADLNGMEKVIDYSVYVSPFSRTLQACLNSTLDFPADDNGWNCCPYIYPGGTGFDYESYDFGPNGSIVSPSIYFGLHQLTLPGGNPISNYLKVKFIGNSYVNRHFYYTWGGCYESYISINTTTCLLPIENNNISAIYPNPTFNTITITSKETINDIEISDLLNINLKRIKTNGTKSITINIFDLIPGIYNCKITSSKGTEIQRLIIQR